MAGSDVVIGAFPTRKRRLFPYVYERELLLVMRKRDGGRDMERKRYMERGRGREI